MNLNKCDMAEKYLMWLMLREIIGECINLDLDTYEIGSSIHDAEKMKQGYIRLTKELLKDYELPAPKQDESGKGRNIDSESFVKIPIYEYEEFREYKFQKDCEKIVNPSLPKE